MRLQETSDEFSEEVDKLVKELNVDFMRETEKWRDVNQSSLQFLFLSCFKHLVYLVY